MPTGPRAARCRLDVKHADGTTERVELSGFPVRIGSGAHCDVRLAPGEAEADHLHLIVEADAVRAQCVPGGAWVTLEGKRVSAAMLQPGVELGIGRTCLRVTWQFESPEPSKYWHWGVPALAMVGVSLVVAGAATWLWWTGFRSAHPLPEPDGPDGATVPAPAESAACGAATQAAAERLGRRRAERAGVAELRGRVVPEEVRVAAAEYRRAAVCLDRSGDRAFARRLRERARQLDEQLSTERRLLELEIEQALSVADWLEVRRQASRLRALLSAEDTELGVWLAAATRQAVEGSGGEDP